MKRICLTISTLIILSTLLSAGLAGASPANALPQAPDGPGAPTMFTDTGQFQEIGYTQALALGDLDGDEDLDAMITTGDEVIIWFNDGQGVFTNPQSFGTSIIYGLALGDLDNDDDLDVYLAKRSVMTGMPDEVWLNDGNGHFDITNQSLGTESSYGVALGDVDEDGDLDAVTAACGDVGFNDNQLWINNGTGYFTNSGLYFGSECTSAVALGDIDASGSLDIVFGNAGSDGDIEIWQNDATGVFSLTQTLDRDYNFDVALKDLDGDTDLDLFVANGQAMYAVAPDTIWINDGTGVFTDTGQRLGSETGNAVAVADLDLDGDLDAFVGNGAPDWPLKSARPAWEWMEAPAAVTPEGSFAQSNIVWLNDGHAAFTNAGESLETLYTLDVALGDLDNDGDIDAFVGNNGTPNQVLLNNKIQPAIALPRLWLPMIVR